MNTSESWQFWIDRGGTFTDVIGISITGRIAIKKLLSENPEQYDDAALEAIRQVLELPPNERLPSARIRQVRMGTTIATNALLERRGIATLLVVNKGFKDCLRIAYQNRPDIFAQVIELPEMLYTNVVEIPGRLDRDGRELEEFDEDEALELLESAWKQGIRSCAVALMHSYKNPEHEQRCAKVAKAAGFDHVTISNETSPLIKLIPRGDTTVADAYLSPILQAYLEKLREPLEEASVFFMQSNGGLVEESMFRGKDSLLSGPAGGVVGATKTAAALGFNKIIGFDMGGTSTDVCHFDGEFEQLEESIISGIRIRVPMLAVHTIAAGGGSIVRFDGHRFRVGPESAGAIPGPASYKRGGPLTLTDCNVLLGRIRPDCFPEVFGKNGNEKLDSEIVESKFQSLRDEISDERFTELSEIAWGFIEIGVEKMAQAIRKITVERGIDLRSYALVSFGGAGGQHACLIAERLGVKTVLIHPLAGVLSALGIGLSEVKVVLEHSIQQTMDESCISGLSGYFEALERESAGRLERQGALSGKARIQRRVRARYKGTDTTLTIKESTQKSMHEEFHTKHFHRFGYSTPERTVIVDSIYLESTADTPEGAMSNLESFEIDNNKQSIENKPAVARIYTRAGWQEASLLTRLEVRELGEVRGPSIILDDTGTNIVEPGWKASIGTDGTLVLERESSQKKSNTPDLSSHQNQCDDEADPIKLELFNNKFMSIAEEMGATLRHTSQSVNIKERLDFSCAVFDPDGRLIANAPHMPVHLGSMGESVRSIIETFSRDMQDGDVFLLNNPYRGGTHLPDITVVTPVFSESHSRPIFYTASRGHHADIGGITPGSMPPGSKVIDEEGALFDPTRMVRDGRFDEDLLRETLMKGPYPSRNVQQNLSDLKAQIAANNRGVLSLNRLIAEHGEPQVRRYMSFVKDNAESCVREAISFLTDGRFEVSTDDGAIIKVDIKVDKENRAARIDFSGTSPQLDNNLNAPKAVTIACVLYVFRTLIKDNIPLNDGCLEPLDIVIPEGSMLNPKYPSAVVAGNVETSQAIVDALYGALGVMAAAQGTMNNLTFGNDTYQYYETICGGSGATAEHNGTDAVHTHMTNSRLTDPEILEYRFPVLVKNFHIREGSGGNGRQKGGDGVVRTIEFREAMSVSILSQRRVVPPFGLLGGDAGMTGNNYLIRCNGEVVRLSGTDSIDVIPGESITIETPGGGGFGKASEP